MTPPPPGRGRARQAATASARLRRCAVFAVALASAPSIAAAGPQLGGVAAAVALGCERGPGGNCTTSAEFGWEPLASRKDEPLIERYLAVCRDLQVLPNADALIRLQLGSPRLTIRPNNGRQFGDLELRALVTLLEDAEGEKLSSIRFLDLSACSLGPSGAVLVAHLLRHPRCVLETLDMSNQAIMGYEGAAALTEAVLESRTLKVVQMPKCELGDEGGQLVVDLLEGLRKRGDNQLEELNLENNFIGFRVCSALLKAGKQADVQLRLQGNRVMDEVFNAVSHGVGEVLAIFATFMLCRKVSNKPFYYFRWTVMYCAAINVMFTSSTLYHSFFALGRTTVHVFSILDYSAIFLLIAGSYSPFLGILFHGECWAQSLLNFMWAIAFIGISTAAFYTGPFAMQLRVSLYLSSGWTILVCIRSLANVLGKQGTLLLFIGGVLYTVGVPFFVRDRHTFGGVPDHTVWHIFVLLAAGTHYLCVYWYVADRPLLRKTPGDELDCCEAGQALEEQLVKPSARGPEPVYTDVPLRPL